MNTKNTTQANALHPYYLTISETLSRSVIVWADGSESANDLCNAGEIDLTASDFAGREIQCDGVAAENDLNTVKQYSAENDFPNTAAKANSSHYGYSSEEIAAALGKAAGLEGTDLADSAEKALYRLKTICENPLNDDSYRDLWKLLERVALNIEDTDIYETAYNWTAQQCRCHMSSKRGDINAALLEAFKNAPAQPL